MASKKADNYCMTCNKEFKLHKHFLQHMRDKRGQSALVPSKEAKVQHVCEVCRTTYNDEAELLEHRISQHFVCLGCNKCHNSLNDLKLHLVTHNPKDIKCYGCDLTFGTESAMVHHLETGKCSSGVDRDWVTKTAFHGPKAALFTNRDLGSNFQCPECQAKVRCMSFLLQHKEIGSCEGLGDEALVEFKNHLEEVMSNL